jgi:hypothetical protein
VAAVRFGQHTLYLDQKDARTVLDGLTTALAQRP